MKPQAISDVTASVNRASNRVTIGEDDDTFVLLLCSARKLHFTSPIKRSRSVSFCCDGMLLLLTRTHAGLTVLRRQTASNPSCFGFPTHWPNAAIVGRGPH